MARDKHNVMGAIEGHKRRKEIIEKHPTVSSLSTLFLQKGERDLQVATANLELGKKEKNPLSQSAFFNWVIVIGYYSMFHSARAALARISVYVSEKSVHESVLNGMYHYYLYSGLIEDKIFYMLESATEAKKKAAKLIEKLDTARMRRGSVNYEVARAVMETVAKDMINDSKEFIGAMRKLVNG